MEKEYLIIIGTNKAGTTSLFDYLENHPEIEGSFVKQTFFFLDKSLQEKLDLGSVYYYNGGLHLFDSYFSDENRKYKLEASPDYLYAKYTPKRLHNFMKDRK